MESKECDVSPTGQWMKVDQPWADTKLRVRYIRQFPSDETVELAAGAASTPPKSASRTLTRTGPLGEVTLDIGAGHILWARTGRSGAVPNRILVTPVK